MSSNNKSLLLSFERRYYAISILLLLAEYTQTLCNYLGYFYNSGKVVLLIQLNLQIVSSNRAIAYCIVLYYNYFRSFANKRT